MEKGRLAKGYSGYLTVYLALTMTVMLSFCLALIEGVRSNAIRMETECVTEIGLNSVLAEYHRELFAGYNLFAVDSSYGTLSSGTENMTRHLQEYMARNLSMEDIVLSNFIYRDFLAISVDSVKITRASIFTDGKGTVFRRRAVDAILDDCNLTLLQELQQWMQTIEDKGLRERDVEEEKRIIDEQIQSYNGCEIQITETETGTVSVENPTQELEQIKRDGILKYVVGDETSLSHKSLISDNLIQTRMEQEKINKGNISVAEPAEGEQFLEHFLFQEYLLQYMGHYGMEKEEGALNYQIEYLLAGRDKDVDNLRSVANTICALREAANAMYIFSDAEKCSEAELVATAIAGLLQVPELAYPLKITLLLGWAYAESIYDVKILLAGGKVPLMKDSESWHYDIQGALKAEGDGDTAGYSEGLCYEDYLRILMMFADLDMLTARAMNMVEADIRLTPGNRFFRMDNCYDRLEFCIRVKSKYGYEYEITRQKAYE